MESKAVSLKKKWSEMTDNEKIQEYLDENTGALKLGEGKSFYCPECECSREMKLHIDESKVSSDNGRTWSKSRSFCFRCPKCYFDLGGGSL